MIKLQEQYDRFKMQIQKNLEVCTIENLKKIDFQKWLFPGNPSAL